MGEVWQVRHLGLNRIQVLKLINPSVAIHPVALQRFKRESEVMAALDHPNIVKVFDADFTSTSAYILMEFVQGRSLKKLFDEQPGIPRSPEWTEPILEQLCNALQEVHDKGIVHRDLKPSNLMLIADCPPGKDLKVLDFGIAKVLGADSLSTNSDGTLSHQFQFLGTAQYASPEQVVGAPLDGRSDLYSVGVILYEFLTGHRPFSGDVMQLCYHHCYSPPPPFAEKSPAVQVPPRIEQTVLRCLAKDPSDRFKTARDLAEAFARAIPAKRSQLGASAIADWSRVIRLNPRDAAAFRERGRAYAGDGQFDHAVDDFNEAIRLNPEDAAAYRERGAASANLGNQGQAVSDYSQAIRLNPKDASAYLGRGKAHAKKRRYNQALADFDEAIRLAPDDAANFLNRGKVHAKQGRYDQALADFNEAIRLAPDDALAYFHRGNTYSKEGKYDQAIADYGAALQRDPNDATTYNNRGSAHANRGDQDRAIADFDEAIRLAPDDAPPYLNRGKVYAKQGKYDQAIADLSAAIRLDPDDLTAHRERSEVYATKAAHGQAIADHITTNRLDHTEEEGRLPPG